MPKVLTNQKCHCGQLLELEISKPEQKQGAVGWGSYSRHSGKDRFILRCVCDGCGAVFDPDHQRFAAYYNMAADGTCLRA